ncbi:neuropilin 2 S homeolog isoform X2 [Xenopus laevis]|uniref:Neuropilin n=1 Tax=Xenopus laevis TaxID=8355 RepID=A0A8J0TXR0_XENLA|nr:neuropilin 2 S homeolog isoform X2 [Xenopus laevis]
MDVFALLLGLISLCSLGAKVSGQEGSVCGGRLNAKDAGYITSPGYPNDYPPHQNCEWIISAPEPNQKIVLNFNPHFDIEKHDCKYDFIEIRDGDSESAELLGKHCGNIAPSTITSSGSQMYIRFTSDYARQGAGFSLRYEIFKTGSEDCSRNFTNSNGTIESPGFPDKYPHNLDCVFTIVAKPKMEIILQFHTFDLEHDPLQVGEGDCKYDWLDIWDGVPSVGPLIGRYCGTKTPSEIRSSTGILSLTFHTDMAVAKDGFSARYYLAPQEVPETFQCNVPLGMESGRISNEQITASSTYSDGRWTAQQSRLNSDDNGWTPNVDTNREYLQIDLRFLFLLTAVATQGAISRETQTPYYVKSYKLEVSTNGEDWMMFRHGKNHKIFQGNTDPTEVVLNKIPQPVLARFIRFRPQTWDTGIAMRVELYGCQITDSPCSNMLGMMSGLISDSQITASSTREYLWSSGVARLVSSRSGWYTHISPGQIGKEWLQVDLGTVKTVRGVIIQGARGGDSLPTTENRAFVRKFKVAHSLNGNDWEYILDSKTEQAKQFEGNMHYDTPEVRRFEPVAAQFVRVYPERWSPAGMGMRMEVLGCDRQEAKPTTETVKPTIKTEEVTTQNMSDEETTECGEACVDEFQYPPGFNCNFDHSDDVCSWTHDTNADFTWSFHPHSPWMGHSGSIAGNSKHYLRLPSSGRREGQHARLLSPKMYLPRTVICMVFRYRASGSSGGTLQVLRKSTQENRLLWKMKEEQESDWREGRIILNSSKGEEEYQVVIEGIVGKGQPGEIAVDDIRIAADIPVEHCMVDIPVLNTDLGHNFVRGKIGDELYTALPTSNVVTPRSDKEESWLYTLDPILVTIIAMSSLGVLFGAICAGLLLYCTCSYTGLSSRSSTTLENYNFELYDGIKHKVKMNPQKCCSEA